MSRFDHEPDYDALIKMLILQTKQEKLRWEPTARDAVYACAVKGQKTFIVTGGSNETATLQVADKDGKVQLSFGETRNQNLYELFNLARRQADRIDEKVDETLTLLKSL